MVDWSKARAQFENMAAKNGTLIEYLQRVTSGSDAYDTSSAVTYGYGDFVTYWITGSLFAIIQPLTSRDIVVEAGFREEDYKRLWVSPSATIEIWEQCIVPSGSGIRYHVRNTQDWNAGNVNICTSVDIRKLVPRSGSAY